MPSLEIALKDKNLVQSFSGVRSVLGLGPKLAPEHALLVSCYGYGYISLFDRSEPAAILIGRDPRPTGAAIALELARGFLAGGIAFDIPIQIVDLGIITTPLAQTAVRELGLQGGVIITASHNPLNHNGFKFLTGINQNSHRHAPAGALLSAEVMEELIRIVQSFASNPPDFSAISNELLNVTLAGSKDDNSRVRAERAYLDVIGRDWGITPHCLKPLTLGPVLVDPNGGAGCGIDARVLEHFGVRVIEVNAETGYPEHAIDTDGIDPASGRHTLLRVARATARERAHFGVAFDYDADRGNLVLPGQDESAIVPPQQAASLNIALALARRKVRGEDAAPLAVVTSDATSLASYAVARAFGAEVFTVETGEINVVTRMSQLRSEGYDVPVGVEGANGGTIFESSTCRDGLQVALSAAEAEANPDIAGEWMHVAGQMGLGASFTSELPSLEDILKSIPTAFNRMLRLSSAPGEDAGILHKLEKSFEEKTWPQLAESFGSYQFQYFSGACQVASLLGLSGSWRVMLGDEEGFIFLRQSRTERGVWRLIVDVVDEKRFTLCSQQAVSLWNDVT